MNTPEQQVQAYYQNLLIIQYLSKPKAFAQIGALVAPVLEADSNIQLITFSAIPTSGTFVLSYNGISTGAIAWNASALTIQGDFNAILIAPLTVAVTGTIASGLTFTFSNFTSAVLEIGLTSSLLDSLSNPIMGAVTAIGQQLPLEIQDAFNLTTSPIASGVQLDVLGKYIGVKRSGFGFNGPITLNDDDFLTLIQMGIVRNSSGSSLETIQNFLNEFFPGQVFVIDYTNMDMSYLIDTAIGTQVIDLFVTEGLLPKPMGVGLSVIAAPIIDKFFGLVSYDSPVQNPNTTPLNNYDSYQTSWLMLSYDNAIPV